MFIQLSVNREAFENASEIFAPGWLVSRHIGGADRDRTDDLRLAKPALSQLSYSPDKAGGPGQS